jgi:hypothetical protein
LKDLYDENTDEVEKIKDNIQKLIFYLAEEIREREEKTSEYKMRLYHSEYQGIAIKYSLGKNNFVVTPSIFGSIVSKAKNYVKIIDPWANIGTLQTLSKMPENMSIKLLTPEKIEKEKRFKKTYKDVRKSRKIEARKGDLEKVKFRYIISEDTIWRLGYEAKGKITSQLLRDRKSKEKTIKFFDSKWKKAKPIISIKSSK